MPGIIAARSHAELGARSHCAIRAPLHRSRTGLHIGRVSKLSRVPKFPVIKLDWPTAVLSFVMELDGSKGKQLGTEPVHLCTYPREQCVDAD